MFSNTIKYNEYIKMMLAFLTLVLGGFIYITYRPHSLLMFDWFNFLNLSDFIDMVRLKFENTQINSWVKFNMPAALWLFSYLLIIDVIWKSPTNRNAFLIFFYSLPIIAILSEFLQLLNIIPGTFDFLDVLSYSGVTSIYLIVKHII